MSLDKQFCIAQQRLPELSQKSRHGRHPGAQQAFAPTFSASRIEELDQPTYLRRRIQRLLSHWQHEEAVWLRGYLRKLKANQEREEALRARIEQSKAEAA